MSGDDVCPHGGKHLHDREEAYRQLVSLKRSNPRAASGKAPYRCRHCGWWHIGHQIGTNKRRRRQPPQDDDNRIL